jgi:hypothetical protein
MFFDLRVQRDVVLIAFGEQSDPLYIFLQPFHSGDDF